MTSAITPKMAKIRQNKFYIASVFNIKEDGDKDRYQDVTQTWNKTKKNK